MLTYPCQDAAVLLGAGASHGIVPLAAEMTGVLLGDASASLFQTEERALLRSARDALAANLETDSVDIEDLANTIGLLTAKRDLGVLVSQWANWVNQAADIETLAEAALKSLSRAVANLCLKDDGSVATGTLEGLFCQHSRFPIVTLNYDTVVETVARRRHLPLSIVPKPTAPVTSEAGQLLLKVHGSADLQRVGTLRGRDRDGGWAHTEIVGSSNLTGHLADRS